MSNIRIGVVGASGKMGRTLLRIAGELGLLPPGLAGRCGDSYRMMRHLQHRQRLNDLPSRVQPLEVAFARESVRSLWQKVFGND